MAKRIYWQTMKKWALVAGVPVVAGFVLLFMYLSFLGVISVTGYSGDMVCAGTLEDPCTALINFSVKEDIFIYPIDYDPYGRDTPFETDVELESWKMYRSWGSGWREIKLDETCTGTWCGAPNNKGVKYSFVFRKGRDYKIKIEALKKNPFQDVKWGFGPVDPIWIGIIDIQNRTYINNLRTTNTIRLSNDKLGIDLAYKSYDSSTKEILIEDKDYKSIIKMRLISPYIVSGLIASNDTKVVEFYLIDWKNDRVGLMDEISFFNVKEDYKEISKVFRYKYGIEVEDCENIKLGCHNYTNWIPFEILDELPHKNIKISAWTSTEILEEVEWIPIINGFEILEWAAWEVSTASYNNIYKLFTEEISPTAMAFKLDGTKLYIVGTASDEVQQYACSTAWNVSTCVHEESSSTIANIQGITFSSDGSKFYVILTPDIVQWSMSVDWDVSTATDDSKSKTVQGDSYSVVFKTDGTEMYTFDFNSNKAYQYPLDTAWDVSTAQASSGDVGFAGTSQSMGMAFKPDGTKIYISERATDKVFQYACSIDWDLTSCTIAEGSYDASSQVTQPSEIVFEPNGARMYIFNTPTDTIFQYFLAPLGPEDTCTCAGLNEDWEIDMSDNCIISDDCDLGTGTLSFTGAGNMTCDATIDTTDLGDPGSNGIIYIFDECKININ